MSDVTVVDLCCQKDSSLECIADSKVKYSIVSYLWDVHVLTDLVGTEIWYLKQGVAFKIPPKNHLRNTWPDPEILYVETQFASFDVLLISFVFWFL